MIYVIIIYVRLCLNQGKNGKDGEPGPAGADGGPVGVNTNITLETTVLT